jgi:hypothetical protein
MQSKIACDHDDHDHYADNVKDIHCFAPIETTGVERYWWDAGRPDARQNARLVFLKSVQN